MNVLLILTDQHRLSAVGCYGPTPCQTPNIDALAAEGVRFENAYTTTPLCSPARATLITGLYPHAHGMTKNAYNPGCVVSEIPDSPDLLPRRLAAAGCVNGYTGKWHMGSENTPHTVGFVGHDIGSFGGWHCQAYKDFLADRGCGTRVEIEQDADMLDAWSEDVPAIWPAGQWSGSEETTLPYFAAENTLGLMDQFAASGRPWFLWHNFWGPHGPFWVPREFVDIYRDVEIPPWPNYDWPAFDIIGPHQEKLHPLQKDGKLAWEHWAMMIRYYYAYTTLIDRQVGRIMGHLRDGGQLDNTAVIFTADHGQTLGSHGGLTDKGWHHFEETHRIPMIVRLPDGAHGGQVRTELASLADIYPTVLDLAGCNAPGAHGRSLMPLIDGTAGGWRDCVVTAFEGLAAPSMTQRTVVSSEHLKYGHNVGCRDELYDLAVDPHETRNVIDDPAYDARLLAMRHHLHAWMLETGDPLVSRFERNVLKPHEGTLPFEDYPV